MQDPKCGRPRRRALPGTSPTDSAGECSRVTQVPAWEGFILRLCKLLLCSLVLALIPAAAAAGPTFVFQRGFNDPANFEASFNRCVGLFNGAGGLAGNILGQLNGAEVVVSYQKGAAGVSNPEPGGDSTGAILYLHWDSGISGRYDDKAPKTPCATLLHELQHAGRYFVGKECTGAIADNAAAYQYDEKVGARAENWWLQRTGLQQRKIYPFFGQDLKLDRWTRWPASPDDPVPAAPACNDCETSGNIVADRAPACRRCTNFHQAGCVDFHGGIYSGGDHRRVANGSLEILIGDQGYCQGRAPCEFKTCVTCPHLDTAFPKGVSVTAIATPGEDSVFARWGPGACHGKGATCTFTAQKPSCISAQFLLTNPTAPPQALPMVACAEDP